MKPKIIKIFPHEKVIAVVPEYCSGPGWSNAVTWVHIIDYSTGKHRCEDIQPDERTIELNALFAPGASMNAALMSVVKTKYQQGNWNGRWFESKMHNECFADMCESGDGEYTPYSNERPTKDEVGL